MDRRERSGEPLTAMLAALQGMQGQIWTALPGILTADAGAEAFDPVKRTARIQPTVQARVQKPDGTFEWVTLPVLLDCPVFFPSGGGVTLTFPLRNGDECLVIFSSRCIDAWWQSGGIQVQPELRMHDLSDGFCFAGVSSVPNVIPAISPDVAQLRTDSGDTYLEIDPDDAFVNIVTPGDVQVSAGGDVNVDAGGDITADAAGSVTVDSGGATTINASGGATINATTTINGATTINGTLHVNGAVVFSGTLLAGGQITAPAVSIGGISFGTHRHTGVQTGGGTSGGPV